MRRIGYIEELRPELQIHSFSDGEALEEGKIEVHEARLPDDTDPRVPEVIPCGDFCVRRCLERVRVDPVIRCVS